MGVKIGQASIDENGKICNGKAGDQTKKEVFIREWYDGNWDFVLRPTTVEIAKNSAKACEMACNNNNIGYDQCQRNTLYEQAKETNFNLSKIKTPCECDCSSLMHVCAIAGGANVAYGSNGATTRTLKSILGKSKYYDVLHEKKYLNSDKYLKQGDILVKEGKHTIMVLENGEKANNDLSKKSDVSCNIYRVQIGSYSIKSNAETCLKNIKQYINDSFIVYDSGLYKVQVGTYYSRLNAFEQIKRMKRLGYQDAFVVQSKGEK